MRQKRLKMIEIQKAVEKVNAILFIIAHWCYNRCQPEAGIDTVRPMYVALQTGSTIQRTSTTGISLSL